MDYKRFHLFEKTQVLVTGGGLLAVVFFWLGGYFRPADPLGPIAMLSNGNRETLLLAGGLLLLLAVLAGMTTTRSRPEGGLLTPLVALGGLSLLSDPIRTLLWSYPGTRMDLYGQLILEVLLLGVAVLLAETVFVLVRMLMAKAHAEWVWTNPLDQLTDEQRKILHESQVNFRWDGNLWNWDPVFIPLGARNTLVGNIIALLAHRRDSQARKDHPVAKAFQRGAACLFTGVVAGVILVSLLMPSAQRGQILFSLFAGFTLAALAAQHLFPTRAMFVAWLMPVLTAIIFYLLAGLTRGSIRPQYEALPIDWITAGCSGALLGFWIAGRMRESRVFDTLAHELAERKAK